jgi:hypothetical protein
MDTTNTVYTVTDYCSDSFHYRPHTVYIVFVSTTCSQEYTCGTSLEFVVVHGFYGQD